MSAQQTADEFPDRAFHLRTVPPINDLPELHHPPEKHLITDRVEIGGAILKWTIQFPEELRYPGIIRIVNGFGGFKATSRGLREALVSLGYTACTEEPVRIKDVPSIDDLLDPQAAHVSTHREVGRALRSNPSFKKMPNAKELDLDRTIWLPHSMGGLSVARFADEKPDEAEAIINLMAAGYGSPTFYQIAKTLPRGIPAGIANELIPYLQSGYIDPDIENLRCIIGYYLKNPLRTAGEAWSCLHEDVRDRAKRLQKSGILLGYLAGEHDCLVPPDVSVAAYVDYHKVIKGMGHLGPQLKPNVVAANVSDIVLNEWNLA